jgi:hypothetical protein
MSGISIAPYFPFRRIKITKQTLEPAATKALIDVVPDKRFQPVCHLCGQKAPSVHSWTQRSVRDLNLWVYGDGLFLMLYFFNWFW